ncbi:MAG: excinuclease ABC subunit UvrB [Verrucomicrobia bacterium]|nr:excinuclease ABC subunit UvrB [Verrucomicrobiota bacterium]
MSATTFQLVAPFEPTGDQPQAIAALTRGLLAGERHQVLEGVTGSGKTYTVANVIQNWNKPALVISHNKTLAAQLYGELKAFFPHNAVEYFVSYYDYYQPEAYIPQTYTYIEKDSSINQEIERLRLSATNSLLCRSDVIIVASVSCIYGLGSPEDYQGMLIALAVGDTVEREDILHRLVDIQYTRNDYEAEPGTFRVRGDTIDVFPSYAEKGVRIDLFGDDIERIRQLDPVTGKTEESLERALISPAKHFVMPYEKIEPAIGRIFQELEERIAWYEKHGKLLEAQRIQQRTMFDIEMLKELGYCSGIENYSRHLSGRAAGEPPATLLDYFGGEFLTIVDESHVTLPQVRGMYNGDQARKESLVEHGFRLPSAKDNRPLNFDEFGKRVGQMIYTSATPSPYERSLVPATIKQVLRPTGLLDPPVDIRPLAHQIDDLMEEVRAHAERHERVLVTTLTKRTAEDLADYLRQAKLRVEYLHSDINAIDRVDILRRLRLGEFDCLIGINLLREGLDLPEVALVAILDADKEGFLRSETALIQIAGRTARHVSGKVILYADHITDAMRKMIDVTQTRRQTQIAYNAEHDIKPAGISKLIGDGLVGWKQADDIEKRVVREAGEDYDVHQVIQEVEQEMLEAATALEFERAAILRDELTELRRQIDDGDNGRETRSPASAKPKPKRKLYHNVSRPRSRKPRGFSKS